MECKQCEDTGIVFVPGVSNKPFFCLSCEKGPALENITENDMNDKNKREMDTEQLRIMNVEPEIKMKWNVAMPIIIRGLVGGTDSGINIATKELMSLGKVLDDNRNLYQAAQELLEAAKKAHQSLSDIINVGGGVIRYSKRQADDYISLGAAINKAEGK